MTKRIPAWLAALALIALPAAAYADGWIIGAGSSTAADGTKQASMGLAFESHIVAPVSLIVRADYDFAGPARVYRSAVMGLRLYAPMRIVHPWLEAGVGLGGNANTSEGGVARAYSIGASASAPLGITPFAEARILQIDNTVGASQITEFRVGGQINLRGGD